VPVEGNVEDGDKTEEDDDGDRQAGKNEEEGATVPAPAVMGGEGPGTLLGGRAHEALQGRSGLTAAAAAAHATVAAGGTGTTGTARFNGQDPQGAVRKVGQGRAWVKVREITQAGRETRLEVDSFFSCPRPTVLYSMPKFGSPFSLPPPFCLTHPAACVPFPPPAAAP